MIAARLSTDDRDADDRMARPTDPIDFKPIDVKEVQADVRAAYERGRADERASRRRHPIFMTLTFVAAICGVALIALAAANGSFSRGGTVADESLQAAVSKAEPQVRDATNQAGQSLRDAGQAAKAKAGGSPN